MSDTTASATRRHRNRHPIRTLSQCACVLIVSGYSVPAAQADVINIGFIKKITWTLAQNLGTNAGQDKSSTYKWDLSAKAFDEDSDHVPQPEKDSATWVNKNGLKSQVKEVHADEAHPQAKARMVFQANKASARATKITATLNGRVVASTVKASEEHGVQEAHASIDGSLELNAGKLAGLEIIRNGARMGKVKVGNKVTIEGNADLGRDGTSAGLKDPIALRISDLTTGEEYYEELFAYDVSALGLGRLSWDEVDGLLLTAPDDGTSAAEMTFTADSDWLIDTVLEDSFLSFSGGELEATGMFAGLPWEVDEGQAFLAAEYVPSMEFGIQAPIDLFEEDHEYNTSLYSDALASGSVYEYAVPSPASALLLAAGGLLTARRRRLEHT